MRKLRKITRRMIPNLIGVWIVVAVVVWLSVGSLLQTPYALHLGVVVGAFVSLLQFRADVLRVIAKIKELLKRQN